MLSKKLENRLDRWTKKLVPEKGEADTIEGEILRAIQFLLYGYYNDGEHWHDPKQNFQVRTCADFLYSNYCIVDLDDELEESSDYYDKDYGKHLIQMTVKVLDHIASVKGKYTPNRVSCIKRFGKKHSMLCN